MHKLNNGKIVTLYIKFIAFYCAVIPSKTLQETKKCIISNCNVHCLFQVILSSAVLSIVFGGNYEVGRLSQSSAQPHRLIPTANGLTQLIMTISMLVIALIMPFVSKLR